jgi:tetratricopeptide (TPR) repeat protein
MQLRRIGMTGVITVMCGVVPTESYAQQEAPKNLQYFPEDMTRAEVVSEMRQFSFALGVRCQYCHVGGDGVSFEGVVFESDDDPDKRKARYMLQMVDELNQNLLPMMADRDEPNAMISCKTCHRGAPKPALLTEVLRTTLDTEDSEAAVAQYRQLREGEGMAGRYDFGEWEMNSFADELAAEDRPRDAIAMYELNLEFHPESGSIILALARLHEGIDETDAAIGYYERALEMRPGDPRLTAKLEELRGG